MKYFRPKSPAGFCRLHNWPLSVRQIRVKGCTNTRKQYDGKPCCRWFVKIEEHPWWDAKRKAREQRKGAG